jgi:hypothetical protein
MPRSVRQTGTTGVGQTPGRCSMDRSENRVSVLSQLLEDAEGCRAVVASMLLLDLPGDVIGELADCDERLSVLIVAVRRHLGVDPIDERRHAA